MVGLPSVVIIGYASSTANFPVHPVSIATRLVYQNETILALITKNIVLFQTYLAKIKTGLSVSSRLFTNLSNSLFLSGFFGLEFLKSSDFI